jgi:succinyl-CoA synthetase beta subunit
MKVREFEARSVFRRHGLPVPDGVLATSAEAVVEAAETFACEVVVKAQVLAGGRGKAGGVKLAKTPAEAGEVAHDIFQLTIAGEGVSSVLVAPAVDIVREFYLGIVVDRISQQLLLMASSKGGVDIEEVAVADPDAIHRVEVSPDEGLPAWQARTLAFQLGLEGDQTTQFVGIASGLINAFIDVDASLAEVNPLVVDVEGNLLAIDAKLTIDENALYRQPEMRSVRQEAEENPAERRAREAGVSYIKLDGSIGCMVNGAGLAMATMDVIKNHGGEPANFLDVGGGAGVERITEAFDIILSDENVKAVLINIFGGITRADDVATGVIEARRSLSRDVPIVVRVAGTREAEAKVLLEQEGLRAEVSMDRAAARVVEAVS